MNRISRIITRLSMVLATITALALVRSLHLIFSNDYARRELLHLAVFGAGETFGRFMVYFAAAAVLVLVWTLIERSRIPTRAGLAAATILALASLALIAWWELSRGIVGYLRMLGVKPWLMDRHLLLLALMAVLAIAAFVLLIRLWVGSRACAALGDVWFGLSRGRLVHRLGFASIVVVLVFGQFLPAIVGGRTDRGPNVILISIDTVRADHLALRGYPRVTTPNLDALAGDGIFFKRCYSQAPWTLPSMTTILTSLYPHQHGAILNKISMTDDVLTLAEAFRNADYATVGVISHTFVGDKYGFDQGFQVFDDRCMSDGRDISSARLTDTSIDYLERHADEKLFMWVHYFDPHSDYVNHPEFPYSRDYEGELGDYVSFAELLDKRDTLTPEDLDHVRDVYDSEISFTDLHVGRLLDALERLGIRERTIVAVVADHGEAFGDHDHFGHGRMVFDELVNVLLVLYDPTSGEPGGVIHEDPVEARWLPRTLLNAAGLDGEMMGGVDLQAVVRGRAQAPPVFTEGCFAWGEGERKLAVVLGNWKLIHHFDDGHLSLYNLADDPLELNDVYSTHPDILYDLTLLLDTRLEEMENRGEEGVRTHLSEDDYQRLESLGYI